MKTKVIFRTYADGQVIALFPYLVSSNSLNCLSYMHIGQHAGADYIQTMEASRAATESEYSPLKSELENMKPEGYDLQVIKHVPNLNEMYRTLRKQINP